MRLLVATGRWMLAAALLGGCGSTSAEINEAARRADSSAALVIAPRPPAEEYRIGPRDLIAVAVFELEKPGEFTRLELEVNAHGRLFVPFAGFLNAAGRTTADLREALATALRGRVLREPEVVVALREARAFEVSVTGAVVRPGIVHVARNRVTLLDALAHAGGLSKEAGTTAHVIGALPRQRRPNQPDARERATVDVVKALVTGEDDLLLAPGARVHVPEAADFYVTGFVQRGGGFPYRRPTTVLQAIGLAGGLDERKASPSCVTINRPGPEGVEVIEVDLGAVAAGEEPDVPIQPGDTIVAGRTVARAVVIETLDALKGLASFALTPGAF